MTFIRPAAVAGTFYPGDARDLDSVVRNYLARAFAEHAVGSGTVAPKALVAPHAGYVYSGALAAQVFAALKPAAETIRRVVLLGPCHRVPLRGLGLSDADAFTTPLGDIPIDKAAINTILPLPQVQIFDETHAQEHSLEVQLPFLQVMLGDFALVPLVVGSASSADVAEVITALWGGPETLIVISSDLSHYLDYDSACKIDAETCESVERLDPDSISDAQACGRIPLKGLLKVAKAKGMRVETVGLCNSGDTAGPRDRVVGYGGWAFFEDPGGATESENFEDRTRQLLRAHGTEALDCAAASIRHGLEFGEPLAVDGQHYSPALGENGACFVTLKHGNNLRGCIGSPEAWRPLIQDIAENAYAAGFRDPRFAPLERQDLEGLSLSISVLSPPVSMSFQGEADLLDQLRPGIDGLIIEDQGKRALFLPSVWDQLPNPADFLGHLKNKAGMAGNYWSDTFAARRFIAGEISTADVLQD